VNVDLSHLDSAVRPLALSSARERIHMISKDLFIEHEYSKHLNDTLDALLCEPRHGRMPCWLITGDAGMGKTAHLFRFARRYADRRRLLAARQQLSDSPNGAALQRMSTAPAQTNVAVRM
jgi:predicted ATP-dependent serine protease